MKNSGLYPYNAPIDFLLDRGVALDGIISVWSKLRRVAHLLKQNHTRAEGVWLISYKKDTGKPRFEYDNAVEEALCFGWIDSKPNKLDDERAMLCFAPRKAR